jgi:hypothetical protein
MPGRCLTGSSPLSTLIEASLYAALGFFVDMVSCWSLSTARVDIRVDKALKVQKKRIESAAEAGVPAKRA